jgi:hypothetical protein
MTGRWEQIQGIITERTAQMQHNQKPDGAFAISPDFLKSDESSAQLSGEEDRVILCTGHHLEWLVFALPSARLRDDWIVRAVDRLSRAIEVRYPNGAHLTRLKTEEECFISGFLGHAVSGLSHWWGKVNQ